LLGEAPPPLLAELSEPKPLAAQAAHADFPGAGAT